MTQNKYTNKQSNNRRSGANGWLTRLVLLTLMLIGIIILAFIYLPSLVNPGGNHSQSNNKSNRQGQDQSQKEYRSLENSILDKSLIPQGDEGQVIHHKYYSLSYNEETEQSNWVVYRLTKASLDAKNVPRAKRFKEDKAVSTRSAAHSDYSHSGYTRGHLAPAGDMAFSSDAMKECFYMSNMSPQMRVCNNGIWKELEETTREWALIRDELIIATGPIFDNGKDQTIGKNKVVVPSHFYKIIIDEDTKKNISFIIPNALSNKHLNKYITSINEIERKLNLDFFNGFLSEEQESQTFASGWAFDERKYNQRVNSWNKEK